MKTNSILTLVALASLAGFIHAQSPAIPPDGLLVIDAAKGPRALPCFLAVDAVTEILATPAGLRHTSQVKIRVLQGQPDRVTLDLTGEPGIKEVTGDWIAAWAVREEATASGPRRLLEIIPKPAAPAAPGQPAAAPPVEYTCTISAESGVKSLPQEMDATLLGIGGAAGFASRVTVRGSDGVEVEIVATTGLLPGKEDGGVHAFLAQGTPTMKLRLVSAGGAPAAELTGASLALSMDPGGKSLTGVLTATAVTTRPDAVLPVLRGHAAVAELPAGDGIALRLLENDGGTALAIRAPGSYPVRLVFAAPVETNGGWHGPRFAIPSGTVVPASIAGLGGAIEFDPSAQVFPATAGDAFAAHLPADGTCDIRWRATRGGGAAGSGKLFLNSTALIDIGVSSGMVRQTCALELRALQGELAALDIAMDGPGEILAVEGANVAGWSVAGGGAAKRVLSVKLGRPVRGLDSMVITSQTSLAAPPAKVTPLRLTPATGEVRHAGHIRVAGHGAVRVEVTEPKGLMQLAPEQWPGEKPAAAARQLFVFRFPTPDYAFGLAVDAIVPEISVNQIVVHEMGETDRVLAADIELDIREAPVREWEFLIPADHALASLEGADIADTVPGGDAGNGLRRLKVLFASPVQGRRLLSLRLERNEPAKAGPWDLPRLAFPGARAVRGFLGVAATPGFRPVPGKLEGLVETPVSYFPKQVPGLQHAFRLRDATWKARVEVEALGQNVQADLFHLYTLREGMATGSVLVNFFTVGTPATEWRFEVPESHGNLGIDGQGVRGWRRDGGVIVVTLDKPSLGASTLLLTFEQPVNGRGGKLAPGLVRPLGVQGERGFVQVVSPFQMRHSIAKAEGNLLKLEATELPAEWRLLSSAPSLAVFQYNDRPFSIEMDVQGFDPAETAGQMIDFARMTSTISWDGQIVTDARWFVKTRGRGNLRLRLPEGANLWEAKVAGVAVNARTDQGDTLIPLPSHADTITPVEVTLRYGQTAAKGSKASMLAPVADVPTAMGEWEITADRGRALVATGGNAIPSPMPAAASGFAWFSRPAAWLPVVGVLLAAAGSLWLRRHDWTKSAFALALAAMGMAGMAAIISLLGVRPATGFLRFVAPVLSPGEAMSIEVRNIAAWQAFINWPAAILGVVGLGLLVTAALGRIVRPAGAGWLMPLGWTALAAGALGQRAGASLFFLLLGLMVMLRFAVPALRAAWKSRGPVGSAPAAVMLCLLALIGMAGPLNAAPAVESVNQEWLVENGRISAAAVITLQAENGQSIPILDTGANLVAFDADGLRVVKSGGGDRTAYHAVATRDGRLTATLRYEARVGDGTVHFPLPTAAAAVQQVRVVFARPGWEAASEAAIRVTRRSDLGPAKSGTDLLFAGGAATLVLRPQTRDPASEQTRFFAETSNLFLPAPGIINGRHKIAIRPAQGQVSELKLRVPEKFTVGMVTGDGVTDWRFDPSANMLLVTLSPAASASFALQVISQMPTGQLPYDARVSPIRVEGAAGEIGMTGLAFGGDAQPDNATPTGMTPMDAGDFDAALLATGKDMPPLVLHQVFRHGAAASGLTVRVLPVQPEVKTELAQVLSLGEERMVLAADLDVDITRAGIFKLSFAIPDGLELEAASGDALSHWTESKEDKTRVITLNLAGRTMGRQKFALTLAGPFPGASESWEVPRLTIRESPRQSGTLAIVPERGIRVRPLARQNVTQSAAPEGKAARPGALAFRLLQPDWKLGLAIERLEPWLTARILQEATVRDGQTRGRIGLRLRVENAAIKSVRLSLPGLDADDARSARATGDAVTDMIPVPGKPGLWDLRFQRGVLGELPLDIQFQQKNDPAATVLSLPVARVVDSRQSTTFVALRSTGRIELDAPVLPAGWHRADWPAVPAELQDPTDRGTPSLCFRAVDPEAPLAVTLRRHDVAGVLKLRVEKARLTSVVSVAGHAITSVALDVRVAEKASLRLRLPPEATLLALTVHGQSAALAREGDTLLFHILPGPDASQPTPVAFSYATKGSKNLKAHLAGPALDVPMEDVEWQVVLPEGHRLDDYKGALVPRESAVFSSSGFSVDDYLGSVATKRRVEISKGSKQLEEGNRYLAEGKAEQARAAFSQAAANGALDAASNEDARVQLRNLQTQQAVVGLNTRRQKLFLDNASNAWGVVNEQAAQAARDNPLLQGQQEFDPRQLDRMLQGNTMEETTLLNRLADRIVNQQTASTPALRSLDIALPERGSTHTFTRGVQVDGNAPLTLDLTMERQQPGASILAALLLLALVAVLGAAMASGYRLIGRI